MNSIGYRIDRLWRLFGTALSFACFGVGAIVISVTLFPAIRLVSWDRQVRRRRIQRAMRQVMRLFIWLMETLGLLTCEVAGAEQLTMPGQLVIANHPSLIDVVILISLMPEVDCIVKKGLWRNPFLRWPVSWAGYIPNTSSPEKLIEECSQALRAGRSMIVFPEGTRTEPGKPLQLRRGAAQIALAANCPICPVVIEVTPPALTKSSPWYLVPPGPGRWRVEVGDRFVPADAIGTGASATLAARQLTRYFNDRLCRPVTRPRLV